MTLVSKSEFARSHDVSHTAVSKWQKAGWLVLKGSKVDVEASNAKLAKYRDSGDARATRGREEVSKQVSKKPKLETNKVSKKVSGQVSKSAAPKPAAPPADEPFILPGETVEDAAQRLVPVDNFDPDMSIEEARRMKEVYLALLNRLAYEEKAGKVIDLDLARTTLFECARAARDSWLNWPTRVAPLIAADLGIEADKMTDILTEHVHRQIASLGEPEGDFTAS